MTITNQVENILRAVPSTRSSDKDLLIVFMQKSGMNLSDAQVEKFRNMPSFETLRRVRQKIQEDGKYPASDLVKRERKFKSFQMQQQAPSFKADGLEKTLTGQTILPWNEG